MAENYGFSLPNMPAPSASAALRMSPEEQERVRQIQMQQMQMQQMQQTQQPPKGQPQAPIQQPPVPYRGPQGAELDARNALDEVSINDATNQRVEDDKWRGGGLALPIAMARNFIGNDKREAGFRDEETERLTQARALDDATKRRAYDQAQALDERNRARAVADRQYTEDGLNYRSANTIQGRSEAADVAYERQRSALNPVVFQSTNPDGSYGGPVELYENEYGDVFKRAASGEMEPVNPSAEGYVSERVISPEQLREMQQRAQERGDIGVGKQWELADGTLVNAGQSTNGRWYDTFDGEQVDLTGAHEYEKPLPGAIPTAPAIKRYSDSFDLMSQMNAITDQFSTFTDAQKAQADQPGTEVIISWLPGGLERLASENMVYTDPNVRNYRTKLAKLEGDYSRMMSGLAVTGYEMTDRKRWSPYAEGISEQERASRIENLQDAARRRQLIFENTFSMESVGSPAASVVAPPPAAARPPTGAVRNGYTFLGGDPNDPASWEKAP